MLDPDCRTECIKSDPETGLPLYCEFCPYFMGDNK